MKAADATIPISIPTDRAAELGVIGCCLLGGIDTTNEAMELVASPSFFFDDTKTAFNLLSLLVQSGTEVNGVTLVQAWNKHHAGRVNGAVVQPKLVEILCSPESVPGPSMLGHYAALVKDTARRRRLLYAASDITKRLSDPSEATDAILASAENILNDEDIGSIQSRNSSDLSSLLEADLDGRVQRQGAYTGIVTGFHLFDYITDGLQAGEQCIIASRPSVGKTALGVSIAARVCLKDSIPTLFVSLEMGVTALMRRLASVWCNVRMRPLRKGNIDHEEMKTLGHFFNFLRTRPLFMIDGVSGLGSMELSAAIRRHVRRHGIKLVIVDYLQKIIPAHRHEKRTYEVAQVSGQLKAVAEKTKVALLTLAQLNRESDRDKPRRPKLTDLADSGQIERDADVVGLLHRDRSNPEGLAELIVAKNRDGELGTVDLKFNGPYCRFENVWVPEKTASSPPSDTQQPSLPHPSD
jgi:replicative DNA helicase